MTKIPAQVVAMMHALKNTHAEVVAKLKAETKSDYGFLAVKGKLIPFLTPKQLAETWQMSQKTLERWRLSGGGPVFIKVATKQIRYPIVALDEWVRKNLTDKESPESKKSEGNT